MDAGPSRYSGAPPQSRFIAFVLSGAICALLLLALLSMAAMRDEGRTGGAILSAINLSPPPGEKTPTPKQAHQAAKSATSPHQQQAATAPPKLPPRVEIPNDHKVEWPEGFVHMSHADLAAADISNIHSAPSTGKSDASAGGGGNAGGEGPGGAHLYSAQWYHEPRDAEIQGYMRPGQSTGRWAEIACRTIQDYHVEDCHELDEQPRGSGMARVLREAAWQFLVRPPRVDGKSLVGTWVRIHFDFDKHRRDDDG